MPKKSWFRIVQHEPTKAESYRGQAKNFAKEWLDYARASGQSTKGAMSLCVSATQGDVGFVNDELRGVFFWNASLLGDSGDESPGTEGPYKSCGRLHIERRGSEGC